MIVLKAKLIEVEREKLALEHRLEAMSADLKVAKAASHFWMQRYIKLEEKLKEKKDGKRRQS